MSEPRSFKQDLTCVFGHPVAENPTQAMIEAAYQHHNLDWRYLTIEVLPQDLGDAVRGLRAMGFRGGNLTIPHKVEVIQHLDRTTEAAGLMGAVNCIVRDGDDLVGENTDGKGFVQSLLEVTDPTGKNIVMFGAGGAARAIGVEVALAGASQITIVNRSAERGEGLVSLLNDKTDATANFIQWDGDYDIPDGTDVVINATSIGLFPDVDARIPLNTATLKPEMIVSDVIPNPPETRLVREANEIGCTVLDGLGMLVNQGVIGFKLWTGVDPDPSVMRAALEEVFG
ncbi:MAG: shikimate dehydrogenase [Planctomycetaceae bacterium]|nr:shikimate dehydrogenase [Planctomycetaceae bacterium]